MTIFEEIKKPINVMFLLLGLVGITLSIYFYFQSLKTKEISFELIEPASLIYDSSNASSSIKLLDKDSLSIKDNVYILTGIIWNSGDLPISEDDVRKGVSLNLSSAKKILDFKILKQNDAEVAKFSLNKKSGNALGLNWKYFDPKFGFSFQIIYTGNENPDFKISGKILDVPEFRKDTYPKNNKMLLLGIIITVCGSIFSAYFYGVNREKISSDKVRNRLKWYLLIILILTFFAVLLSALAINFENRNPNNPFLDNKYFNKKY